MALVIDFTTSEFKDATGYNFYDNTVTYNSSTKTGGWGTPNPALTDVSYANVLTTLSDGTVCNLVDVYNPGAFPNTDGNPFLITNTLLGIPDGVAIPDGKTKILYTVGAFSGDVLNEYTKEKYVYFLAGVCCCKETAVLKATIDDCCSECKEYNDQVDDLLFNFEILEAAIRSSDWTKSDSTLEIIQGQCRNLNCVNCP